MVAQRRARVHNGQAGTQHLHRARHRIQTSRNLRKRRTIPVRVSLHHRRLGTQRLGLTQAHPTPHPRPARRSITYRNRVIARNDHRALPADGLDGPIRKPHGRYPHTASNRRRWPTVSTPCTLACFEVTSTSMSTPRMRPLPLPTPR